MFFTFIRTNDATSIAFPMHRFLYLQKAHAFPIFINLISLWGLFCVEFQVDWTPELHKKFVLAVEKLGVDQAIPSRILEAMKVEGLTRHNVASHLQVRGKLTLSKFVSFCSDRSLYLFARAHVEFASPFKSVAIF